VIQLRQQSNRKHILIGLLEPGERFDLTMCNPPFHASMDEDQGQRAQMARTGQGRSETQTAGAELRWSVCRAVV
jgi:23S rRNA A1618 N6-methylase RlmF